MTQIPRTPKTPLTRPAQAAPAHRTTTQRKTTLPDVPVADAVTSDATDQMQVAASSSAVAITLMTSAASDVPVTTPAERVNPSANVAHSSRTTHGPTLAAADDTLSGPASSDFAMASPDLASASPGPAPASSASSDPTAADPTPASAAPPLPAWVAIADAALDQIAPDRLIARAANGDMGVAPVAPSYAADHPATTAPAETAFTVMAQSARQDFIAAMIAEHPDYRVEGGETDLQETNGHDTEGQHADADDMDGDDAHRQDIDDLDADTDDIEDQMNLGSEPRTQDLWTVLMASRGVVPSVPLATALDAAEVAALLATHDDPWAMDRDTWLYTPPGDLDLTQVLPLARFCAACGDQAGIDRILSDGCATVILCDGDREIAGLAAALRLTLLATLHAAGTSPAIPQRKPRVVTLPTGAGSTRTTAMATACDGLKRPEALVVLTEDASDLPPALAMLPIVELAPLDRDTLIFALRTLQSATGRISTDAVQDILPSSAALSGLTIDILLHAFRGRGPLRVAARIAAVAAAQPAPVPTGTDGPTLADLPGLGAARTPLLGLVADLRAHAAGTLPWREITSGLILAGPPGTGKTTLAAAIARSAGVPLIATTCSDWHNGGKFNDMIAAMTAVFGKARAQAPAVLFIDEIDSLGSRTARTDHNASYDRHVINTVLAQIDGAQTRDGVLIIGATNHPGLLDPALTRPGRLGTTIHITPPSRPELEEVFRYHLRADLPQIDLGPIARTAAGASMAEVMGMVQAARTTARATGRSLTAADLTAAVGDRHPPVSDTLRQRRAIHAAGHVVAAHVTGQARPISVTLTTDDARTEMQETPHAGDRAAVFRALVTLLAGRAAEAVLLDHASDMVGGGADSDLAKATQLAMTEALSLGRGNTVIWHAAAEDPAALFARHRELRDTVDRRLRAAHDHARAIVTTNRTAVEAIAAHLAVDGHVDRDTLRDLLLFCEGQVEGG